jgi:trans-aconitate methyltransferase
VTWDANGYDSFQKQHQFRCGLELLSKLEQYASLVESSIADLGCGTGELTLTLRERVGPGGSVTAIDNDAGMLAVLKAKTGSDGLLIQRAEMTEWLASTPASYDVLFSNAALHWLPSVEMLRGFLQAAKHHLNPSGFIAFRFSLQDNGRAAKSLLEHCLRSYTGDPTIDLARSPFSFSRCLDCVREASLQTIEAAEISYSPFEEQESDILWMLRSQPLLKYLAPHDLTSFEAFLRKEFEKEPCKVSSHHALFIAQKAGRKPHTPNSSISKG